jgi:pimeloyl-ACP methyl ester carboxylesterase
VDTVFRSESGRQLVHDRYLALLRDGPADLEQLRVPTCEGETFVLACGASQSPPLVLFHRGATTSVMWLPEMEEWSRHFRVYAVDLIGEAGFSAPSRPPVPSDRHAMWLDDVWQGLCLAQASVVGSSYGAWIALDYAIRRQDRLNKLVLMSPAGVGDMRLSYAFKAVPLSLMGAWGRRRVLRMTLGMSPDEEVLERTFLSFSELVMRHFVFRAPLPQFTDEMLRQLTIPVLAVMGGNDTVFHSNDTRRRLEACVTHARVSYQPTLGHAFRDRSSAVLEFLRERPEPIEEGVIE